MGPHVPQRSSLGWLEKGMIFFVLNSCKFVRFYFLAFEMGIEVKPNDIKIHICLCI